MQLLGDFETKAQAVQISAHTKYATWIVMPSEHFYPQLYGIGDNHDDFFAMTVLL